MRNMIFLTSLICFNKFVRGKTFRVIDGVEDIRNEFPFVVTVERDISFIPDYAITRMCSGSLITTNWVLTAGHCLFAYELVVRYGNVSVPRNETNCIRPVLKSVRHPNFSDQKKITANDIGLLLIDKVNLISLGRLSAVNFVTLFGLPVRYAGFGRTTGLSKNDSIWKDLEKDLMQPLKIGEGVLSSCLDKDKKRWIPAMCVWPKCTKKFHSAFSADSGGPVFFDSKIVAFVTAGIPGAFSVVTPVEPFINWISQTLSTE